MGMYNTVEFNEFIHPELPDIDAEWQTKTLGVNALDTYKIDTHGHLSKELTTTEPVPEEDRPKYDPEIDGFHEQHHKAFGALNTTHEGWEHLDDYHGRFEIHSSHNDTFYRLILTYTHGELENITPKDEFTSFFSAPR